MPEITEKIQGSARFQKGQSGNPKGKPRGTRNKATLAAERLLQGELEEICRKLIEQAKEGNTQAIKLVLDRILPPKKNPTVSIKLPKLNSPSDALKAIASITLAVANGELSPAEGETLSGIVGTYVKALEASDFETRLNSLEGKTR